jgi:putative Holliday junction resolvase
MVTHRCVNKARAMGVDYGDKRIGVALSDIGWNIASPLAVLDNHGSLKKLCLLARENDVGVIVVGLPVTLSGHQAGSQLEKVKKFAEKLMEAMHSLEHWEEVELIFWDERLSSVAANRALLEEGGSRASRKLKVDKVAASFMLQGYLDSHRTALLQEIL